MWIDFRLFIIGCFLLETIDARCGKKNFTEWFGRFYYDQIADQPSDTCSWNFIPPQNTSSVLILKVVSFPIHHNTISEDNYIVLPGGSRVDDRNVRHHLLRCKRYVKRNDSNTCSEELLNNYCSGETIESSQWPPTMTSFSSQTSEHGNTGLFNLGFTISYVYVSCPSRKSDVTTFETTSTTAPSAQAVMTSSSTADEILPDKFSGKDSGRSYQMVLLATAIGVISIILMLGCAVVIFVLFKKLRQAKLYSQHVYLMDKDNFGTYAFASENTGTLASTHEYATLRPVLNRKASSESVSVPITGYLTMRGSTEKRPRRSEQRPPSTATERPPATYAEIKVCKKAADPYVNDNEENTTEESTA